MPGIARRLVVAGAVATLAVFALLVGPERTMKDHGGNGIVDLELARGPSAARDIVEGWGDDGVRAARRSIALDWAFIPSYVLLGIGIALAAGSRPAVVCVGIAGACDVVENVAMLRVLDGRYGAQWTAFGFSSAKWTLLGVALVTAAVTRARGPGRGARPARGATAGS